MKTVNPALGEDICEYVNHSPEETAQRVLAAAEAQESWKKLPYEERAPALRRLADLLRKEQRELAELMTCEMGKPVKQALGEVEKCAWVCEHYADQAANHLRATPLEVEGKAYLRYDPLGVVLAIMPWNFPLWQVLRFATPALMAGNGMLLKHAENTTGCALAVERLCAEAGIPEGLVATLLVEHDQIEEVIARPEIAAVTLTGSERAGQAVAQIAGRHLKKCVLELGGSDPFIVLADADLQAAVSQGVKARMQNSGQSCIAGKRFFLHKDIAEEYVRRYIAECEQLVVGDPMDEATDIGPLARMDLRDTLEKQVATSISKGAKVLFGGKRLHRQGAYYPPAVLGNVAPGMPAFDEELFGPVAAMITVQSHEEAIDLANRSNFGLGGSIWTQDIQLAEAVAAELETGGVSINKIHASHPGVPFGGIKKSGYGRELGALGLREFVNIKSVWIADE